MLQKTNKYTELDKDSLLDIGNTVFGNPYEPIRCLVCNSILRDDTMVFLDGKFRNKSNSNMSIVSINFICNCCNAHSLIEVVAELLVSEDEGKDEANTDRLFHVS